MVHIMSKIIPFSNDHDLDSRKQDEEISLVDITEHALANSPSLR